MTSTADSTRLLDALRAALPAGAIDAAPGDRYVIDGLRPSVVVTPSSQTEVAGALGVADTVIAAVVPFGGATRQTMGMTPARYDIALDLQRIDSLVEHEPADLTVTVEAGMRLTELQRLLAARGQWLPLDPLLPAEATIGGVLATNAAGPARLSRGSARDLLIGLTVATPQGQIVKSGGRVVKNVAGYDLDKLHIGGLGTLGVILQASFKVSPLPPESRIVLAHGAIETLTALANGVIGARLALQGLLLTKQPDAPRWTLAAQFAGGLAAVDRSQRDMQALAQDAGLDINRTDTAAWQAQQPAGEQAVVLARVSVLPSEVAALAAEAAGSGAHVAAQPGVGVLHAAWAQAPSPDSLNALRTRAERLGGALVLEQSPPETRRAIDAWGSRRGDFGLMQRLNREMDPKGTLNPGRYIGGL